MKRNVAFLGDGFTALVSFFRRVFAPLFLQRFIFYAFSFLASLKIVERNRTANQNGAD